jgi:uncharacterized protein YodC (DUF2158 family)
MSFNVGDIVKKVGGTQTYEITAVLENSKYECRIYPNISPNVKYTFKGTDLVLA